MSLTEQRTDTGFDVRPTDEQRMMIEAFGDFATAELRPAASAADAACAAPPELLAQSAELGIAVLGVPDELGGAVDERSAITSALITEALAGGDMGLALAALAPGRGQHRARALGRSGSAGHLPTRLHGDRGARRRPRGSRAARPLRSLSSSRPAPDGTATASSSTASSRSSRAPARPSCSSSPPSSRGRARPCSSSRRGRREC